MLCKGFAAAQTAGRAAGRWRRGGWRRELHNIGIIAHIDAGKTTATERMLYLSGLLRHLGNVDEGDTVTDFLAAERARGITIQLAAVTVPWAGERINIVDTPGHADFTFEVVRALRVLDGTVCILDAVAGVEAQTEKVWRQAAALGLPAVVFVNKMDRAGAGFLRTVREVVARLQTDVVLATVPLFAPNGSEVVFSGVVDVVDRKALCWKNSDGNDVEVVDLTGEVTDPAMVAAREECARSREAMIETLSSHDDSVLDAFFACEDYMAVEPAVLTAAIKRATVLRRLVPVLCGAAFRNIGIQPLLDAVVRYLPAHTEVEVPTVATAQNQSVPVVRTAGAVVVANNDKLALSLAFKVSTHPIRGILVFVRVYSGRLHLNSKVVCTRTGAVVRIGKLLHVHADDTKEVAVLEAGDIGMLTGTNGEVVTGDTLVLHAVVRDGTGKLSKSDKALRLLPIAVPPPVFSAAVYPLTQGDRRHLDAMLAVLIQEDPLLAVGVDQETGSTVVSGMGELHLEIVRDRLRDLGCLFEMGLVVVTYKETVVGETLEVTKTVAVGTGEALVTLSLSGFENEYHGTGEPLDTDNNYFCLEPFPEEWRLVVTPETVRQGLAAGVQGALQISGPVSRLPLHLVEVRVVRWSLPEDAPNVRALVTAARLAVTEAVRGLRVEHGECTLLEPVMTVKCEVEDNAVGKVVQDLSGARQGEILLVEADSGDSMDDMARANDRAVNTYVPADYTLGAAKGNDIRGQQTIVAVAPLREVLGYTSRLRSMTGGRASVEMDYRGMRRATRDRVREILGR